MLPLAADGALVATEPSREHARLRPAAGGSRPVIIESIVTTMDAGGDDQFRPDGCRVGRGDDRAQALSRDHHLSQRRPRRGVAVVNLTDDAMLFAQGAISSPQFPWVPATVVRGAVLEAACSWRELEVASMDSTPPRSRIEARVRHAGVRREFLGFNRARHAVLEAAILATRTHLLPPEQIRAEYARLQVIVDKTAGPREQDAMAMLTEYVRSR